MSSLNQTGMPQNPLHDMIPIITVTVMRPSPRDKLGMIVSYSKGGGIQVDTVADGGYIAQSGNITVGDEILRVNGVEVFNQEEKAIEILQRVNELDLFIRKEATHSVV